MKFIEKSIRQVFVTLASIVIFLMVMPVIVFAIEGHDHPICGKNCTHVTNGGTLAEHIVSTSWNAWDGSDQDTAKEGIQLTSGNWYLSSDIAPSGIVEIIGEVNLCLNGKVFSSDPQHTDHRILIPEVAEGEAQNVLNLCDCQETEHKFTPDSSGLWKLDEGNGTKSVKGGVIIGANCWGGAIENEGLLNMYGGNVVGNKVISYGAISAFEPVNIYGGSVCGNTGAAAFFTWHWGVRSNLYGGSIYENTVSDAGVNAIGSSVIGLSGSVEIYDNGIGTQDKNLSCDWSSKVVILDTLNNTNPIGICGDDHVIITADGTNVTDLTDYMDHFVSNEAGKFLVVTTDKKGIELTSYAVTDQPDINNNHTVTVNVPDGAEYQWHKADVTETPYTIQEARESHFFELLFDTFEDGVCIARDYGTQNGANWIDRNGYNLLYLDIDRVRTEGIFRVTNISQSEGITIKLLDYYSGEEVVPIADLAWNLKENNHYRLVALTDYNPETGKSAFDPLPTLTATFSTCETTVKEAISGQTSSTLNTQNLATGKYICKITWNKGNTDASDDAVVLSDLVDFMPIAISGSVDITGDCVYGQTLTANYSSTENVVYQWYRDSVAISGATGSSYTLTAEDVGKTIKVVVAGTGNYTGETYAQTSTLVEKANLTASDFTYVPSSNLTYDGTEKNATVSPVSTLNGVGVVTVKYYDEYGSLLTGTPKNPGTYFVKIDVAEGTNYNTAADLTSADWTFTVLSDNVEGPTLEGIENGKIYYGDLTVIKPENQFQSIKSVTLDGENMSFAEGTYGLVRADNGTHTIIVIDNDDNVTTYIVTVMKNYTVTCKDGDTVIATETVGHGKDANLPSIPAKEGYNQTVPYWDKDGKNITCDTVITAIYTINEYTITFMDANNVYQTLTYKHGETVKMPETPVKDGYTVTWERTIDKATANATIKAVYTENSVAEPEETPEAEETPVSAQPPQTGDNSMVGLWIALMLISSVGVVETAAIRRKFW